MPKPKLIITDCLENNSTFFLFSFEGPLPSNGQFFQTACMQSKDPNIPSNPCTTLCNFVIDLRSFSSGCGRYSPSYICFILRYQIQCSTPWLKSRTSKSNHETYVTELHLQKFSMVGAINTERRLQFYRVHLLANS
jgi:hypothetical protein